MNDETHNRPQDRLRALLGIEYCGKFPAKTAEQVPRIVERLAQTWGTPAAPRYLDSLTVTERSGRRGFPAEVAFELFALASLHDELHPALRLRHGAGDFWADREIRDETTSAPAPD